jgi:hypothetical protein
MNGEAKIKQPRSYLRAAMFTSTNEALSQLSRTEAFPLPTVPTSLYAPISLEESHEILRKHDDADEIMESFTAQCGRAGRAEEVLRRTSPAALALYTGHQERQRVPLLPRPRRTPRAAARGPGQGPRLAEVEGSAQARHRAGGAIQLRHHGHDGLDHGPAERAQGLHRREVDGVMAHLVDQFNPQKWAEHASESFRASTKLPEHESGSSWSGRLYELFEMSWNPQATMSFENYLNVDYKVNDKGVFSTYSLAESLSSKLWLARQAGGLDIDRGYCDIQALGCRAILPLTREQKEEERRQRRHKVSPIRGDGLGLTPERYAASDFYNISILAKKEIRFTPTEDMPGWLASVVNYIAPVMASLWLSARWTKAPGPPSARQGSRRRMPTLFAPGD